MELSKAARRSAPSTVALSTLEHPVSLVDSDYEVESEPDPEVILIEYDPELVFTVFPELPIELRLKVWEHAFPARIVNIIYDQYNDKFHSFNSATPKLLHVDHESREMGLKLYQLCFGTESQEPRIYFDFNKDILLFDDYLYVSRPTSIHQSDPDSRSFKNPLQYAEYPISTDEEALIQRVAINTGVYHWHVKASASQQPSPLNDQIHNACSHLQMFVRPIVSKFAALREMSLVIEDVNPYSSGPIRVFDVGNDVCDPICDVCYISKISKAPIERLKKVYGKMLSFRLVGAYRGASRFSLGCYDGVVEVDPRDDRAERLEFEHVSMIDDNSSDFEFSDDPLDGEVEKSLGKHLKTADLWKYSYDYDDVDQGFSDHSEKEDEDDRDADYISPEELEDIQKDEALYRKVVGGRRQYIDMQDEWVEKEYYDVRMTL